MVHRCGRATGEPNLDDSARAKDRAENWQDDFSGSSREARLFILILPLISFPGPNASAWPTFTALDTEWSPQTQSVCPATSWIYLRSAREVWKVTSSRLVHLGFQENYNNHRQCGQNAYILLSITVPWNLNICGRWYEVPVHNSVEEFSHTQCSGKSSPF